MLDRDHAAELVLPDGTASVLVANSDIADILAQSGRALIVVGKRAGETNVILRDRLDQQLGTIMISVRASSARDLSLYRGETLVEYQCAVQCRAASASGDAAPSPAEPKSVAPK